MKKNGLKETVLALLRKSDNDGGDGPEMFRKDVVKVLHEQIEMAKMEIISSFVHGKERDVIDGMITPWSFNNLYGYTIVCNKS